MLIALALIAITTLLAEVPALPEVPPPPAIPNVVGEWRFDEGSGATTADSSGNGNSGSVIGASWVDSTINDYFDTMFNDGYEALRFDSASEYVRVADSNSLDLTGQLSLEAWVNPMLAGSNPGAVANPARDCAEIKAYDSLAADGLYWLDPDGTGSDTPFQAYCDMTTDGGGWTMCYTERNNMVHLATESAYAGSYGTPGYRTDCRKIPFSEVLYVNHDSAQKAWFSRQAAGDITIAGCGYTDGCRAGSLWTAHGVATTSYNYQLLVCDSSWMWVGLFISGYTSCWKQCGSWCGDTSTVYFRTDGDNDSQTSHYNGVAFNENGHNNSVTYKTMSAGVRRQAATLPFNVINKQDAYGLHVTPASITTKVLSTTLTNALSTGWNHVVATYDSSLSSDNFKLYLNGQIKTKANLTSSIAANANDLYLGSGFYGELDNVRIYSKALTATEVAQRFYYGNGGLLGRWKFDKGFGASIEDSSGAADHGTLAGGVKWVKSTIARQFETWLDNGNSLEFDGNGADYVGFPSTFIFHQNTDATLSFWLKRARDNVHEGLFWTRVGDNDDNRYNIWTHSDGSFGLDYREANGTLHSLINPGAVTLSKDLWHYVVVSRQNKTYSVYVDGRYIAQAVDSSPNLPTSVGWEISGRSSNPFAGRIDELQVFNRALPWWEIKEKYETQSWGLVGRWKFDESSGNTVFDSSNLGNHATIATATRAASTLGTAQAGAPTGNMLTFNGSSDYVSGTLSSEIMPTFALMTWVNPNSSQPKPWGGLVEIFQGSAYRHLCRLYSSTRQPNFYTIVGGDMTSSTTLASGVWSHVACVYDGSKKYIYVNGQEVISQAVTVTPQTIDGFEFGRNEKNAVYMLAGSLDEAAIFHRDLSAQQVFYKANVIRQGGFPTAVIGNPANDASFKVNTPITFTATGSSDPYGQNPNNIMSYFWDFGDGSPILKRENSVSVSYSSTGDKVVKLWVIDQDGNPSILGLGEGLITIHITPSTTLFQRLDNLKMKP